MSSNTAVNTLLLKFSQPMKLETTFQYWTSSERKSFDFFRYSQNFANTASTIRLSVVSLVVIENLLFRGPTDSSAGIISQRVAAEWAPCPSHFSASKSNPQKCGIPFDWLGMGLFTCFRVLAIGVLLDAIRDQRSGLNRHSPKTASTLCCSFLQ